jgi:protein TonB
MYYLETGYGKHDRLRNALLLALGMHVVLIGVISFKSGTDSYRAPQIEVTLAVQPAETRPEDASHIAQADQQGGGEPADEAQLTSPNNQLSSDGDPGHQALLLPQEMPVEPMPEAVTTAAAAADAIAPEDREQQRQPIQGVNPEVDKLSRELANLEAELDRQSRSYAELPRIRRLTSLSAKQSVDAAYLLDWQRRAEAVGNKYYPEASVRYGLYGSLRLLAVIRYDGSLEDIRVLSSSGYAVLDEAAVKTVRMAAPYAPFPPELRATTDKLEIIRTWTYGDKGLSSK